MVFPRGTNSFLYVSVIYILMYSEVVKKCYELCKQRGTFYFVIHILADDEQV